MTTYVIQTNTEKGRSFQGACLGMLVATQIAPWEEKSKVIRPIWSVWGTTEGETGPFIANLRLGKVAQADRDKHCIEFMKSSIGLTCIQQVVPGVGTLTTLFFSEFFRQDPGFVDPTHIQFCLLPPKSWLDSQPKDNAQQMIDWAVLTKAQERHVPPGYYLTPQERRQLVADEDLEELIPYAGLFAVYLDMRTRAPMIQDPRFYFQLLISCVSNGFAIRPALPGPYFQDKHLVDAQCASMGLDDLGVGRGLVMHCTHEQFEELLIRETDKFLQLKG